MIKNTTTQALPAPLWVKIMYALGQMGWSLAAYGVINLLNYFYMPPETAGETATFPPYIYQGAVLGVATIIGLVALGGRLFDAITDPLIATWSDQSTAQFGRRRIFMAASFVPYALLSWLVFCPLTATPSALNGWWLAFTIFLFYLFMTLYVTPYTALISELGHTSNERLNISTFISVTYALGFGLGNMVYALQDYFAQNMNQTAAFQLVMLIFAILSAVLMALPVIFVDERKYCLQNGSNQGSVEAMRAVLSNRNFRFFALSDLMYWLAFTFIQAGTVYYTTVLLDLPSHYVSFLLTGMLSLSFLFYVPVNVLARKIGKKKLIFMGFFFFSILFLLLAFLGTIDLPPLWQAIIALSFAPFPAAIFGILPNAIVADIADLDGQKTGNFKAGIFFATRNLTMKLGISLANFLFPTLLLLGKSADNDWGIRLTAVAACLFCLWGWWLFRSYEEETIHFSTQN